LDELLFSMAGDNLINLYVDYNLCRANVSEYIYVSDSIRLLNLDFRDSICDNEVWNSSFELENSSSSSSKWLFDSNYEFDGNLDANQLEPGSYPLELFVYNTGGCKDSLYFYSVLVVLQSPNAGLYLDKDTVSSVNPEVMLTNTSFNYSDYVINTGNGYSSYEESLAYFYLEEGTYFPFVEVKSIDGCTDIAYDTLVVLAYPTYYIENAFTPNNDGLNDVFEPQIIDCTVNVFQIMNKWGKVLYECSNGIIYWDGTCNGKNSPPGVYPYHIILTTSKGSVEEIFGFITVLR
jgi:gliding motility-associated-like protein